MESEDVESNIEMRNSPPGLFASPTTSTSLGAIDDHTYHQSSIPSTSSSTCPMQTSSLGISALPDEIMVKHILPLFPIQEIDQFKLVCREWLGFVRQYYRQLKVVDVTECDYGVKEELLFEIVNCALNLQELRYVLQEGAQCLTMKQHTKGISGIARGGFVQI